MLLDLAYIVRNIVYQSHIKISFAHLENTLEDSAYVVRDKLTVRPSIIQCATHCETVILGFLGSGRCASKLPIREDDIVLWQDAFRYAEIVAAYLVTQSSAACVDQDTDLALR